VTKVGLYTIGTSTTLESNKSLLYLAAGYRDTTTMSAPSDRIRHDVYNRLE